MNAIGAEPNDWDKHFKMTADINLSVLSGSTFNIIGTYPNAFTGVFDGNGHKIANFRYQSPGLDDVGIFGYVADACAVVKDLLLVDPCVVAGAFGSAGALVNWLVDGTIERCGVYGGRVYGEAGSGGLVVINDNDGQIRYCYCSAAVSGGTWIGGLVGSNFGSISDCYASGPVPGTLKVGGLVALTNRD